MRPRRSNYKQPTFHPETPWPGAFVPATKFARAGLLKRDRRSNRPARGGGCRAASTERGRHERSAGTTDKDDWVHARPQPGSRCSPGAYYSKLTAKVICADSFRTGAIRYVTTTTKHDVEIEHGMTPKSYGTTLEIDHIVSLQLADPTRLPTCSRVAGCEARLQSQGQAREQTPSPRLRGQDDAPDCAAQDRDPLAGALQDRVPRRAEVERGRGTDTVGRPANGRAGPAAGGTDNFEARWPVPPVL